MRFRPAAVLVLFTVFLSIGSRAQSGETLDSAPQKAGDAASPQVEKLPSGTILIKGAQPAASDSATPVPEAGALSGGAYRNSYFGMTLPLPAGWTQPFEGPPPSDSGYYVLAQLTAGSDAHDRIAGSLLIAAQDAFFALTPARDPMQSVSAMAAHLDPALYTVERQPVESQIAGRRFVRMDYAAPRAALHWYVLATEVRCHILQFIFSGRDTKALDAAVTDLAKLDLAPTNGAEGSRVCMKDYATAANVLQRVDPIFTERRFNPIPVRIIVGKDGSVEHVHVISAFPDQAKAVTDALLRWRFRPYLVNGRPVEVETGLMFGSAPRVPERQSATKTRE